MNTPDKVTEVLDKVRDICDLKKLEFGCEVTAMHSDTGYIFHDVINQHERLGMERCRREQLPDWYGGSHFITHGYLQSKDERILGRRGVENIFRLVSIIGLPVHLEHLLWALDFNSTDPTTTISVSCNLMRIEMQGKFEIYNLQKSVEQNLKENPDLTKWLHKLVNKK